MVAHHNGFFELHVCNVKLCGGEISENCFRQGHCQQLQRAWDAHCESRRSPRCAPIDRNYPGRWYLPCSKVATSSYERFGPTVIKYRLPKHLACEHCVLQWYWATGNGCNAPGVIDFFDSDKAPFWGQCRGQGGAVGGVARGQQTCGGSKFAEEYLQCADIRIVKRGTTGTSSTSGSGSGSSSGSGSGSGSGSTSGSSNSVTMVPREVTHPPLQGVSGGDGRGTVDRIYLYADGRIIQALYNKNVVNVGAYSRIAILAHTSGHVTRVDFFIDDRRVWTDYHSPYFMFGNRGGVPRYWNAPIVNSWFKLTVSTPSDIDSLYVAFVK